MKIIFFGTSEFAVPILEALKNSRHEVTSVVTQPPKQKGRGLKVLPEPIEECAEKLGLKRLEFNDVNSNKAVELIKKQNADLFVVVAFGQILTREVLEIPRLYPINIHASLLPRYRGAAPIQRSIIDGDKETGITIIRMNEFLDKGDIIAKQETEISDDDTALSLSRRLSKISAKLLLDTLDKIGYGRISFIKQNEARATYAVKLKKEDGLINWNNGAVSIRNLIRGCNPWPSAYTHLDGKLLKIHEADVTEMPSTPLGERESPPLRQAGVRGPDKRERLNPGVVIQTGRKGILVACKDKALLVKRLQLEGKKPLTAEEFLRGKPLPEGKILGPAI